ncbi:hypothetical protein GIB67_024012 [Kingdonia uniflora]|uniref:Uncharacterized protein n=1 Tax=Kingdonia uniflora TaxID=39325 RepID=A0A7J7LPQ1_9MAGN|nr:hypothetical protein GIB67_024012 [Kingdonia uniflora]
MDSSVHKNKKEIESHGLVMNFGSQLDRSLRSLYETVLGSVYQQQRQLQCVEEHLAPHFLLTIYLVAILRRNLGPILPMTKRALMFGHQGPRLMDYLQGIVMSSPRPREGQGTLLRNAGRFSKEGFIWRRYAPRAIRDVPPLTDGL